MAGAPPGSMAAGQPGSMPAHPGMPGAPGQNIAGRPQVKPGAPMSMSAKMAAAKAAKKAIASKPKPVVIKPVLVASAAAPVQKLPLLSGPFPNARPDPFKPYFNLAALKPVEQVAVTPQILTNLVHTAQNAATGLGNGLGALPQPTQQTAAVPMPRLIGVIKTNGGASVMIDGVDTPLVAGDALPNGAGTITSILADHMLVRTPDNKIQAVYINVNPDIGPANGVPGGPVPNGGFNQPANPYQNNNNNN